MLLGISRTGRVYSILYSFLLFFFPSSSFSQPSSPLTTSTMTTALHPCVWITYFTLCLVSTAVTDLFFLFWFCLFCYWVFSFFLSLPQGSCWNFSLILFSDWLCSEFQLLISRLSWKEIRAKLPWPLRWFHGEIN